MMMIGSGGLVPQPPPVSSSEENSDNMEAEVHVFYFFIVDDIQYRKLAA